VREVWAFLKEGFNTFFWEGFREGLIDLRPVGWDVRLLVVVGLLVVLVTLGATLLFGHGLSLAGEVVFEPDPDSTDTLSIPFVALVLATLVFAVGWAYLLGGAARCRVWVFLVIGLFFGLQTLVLANAITGSQTATLVYACLLPVVVVLALVGYFVLRRLRHRLWAGLLEPLWWLGLTSVFIVLIWVSSDSSSAVASHFATSTGAILVLAAVYWVYLALDVVGMALGLGRWVVTGTRVLLVPQVARWLILIFLLLKPLVAFALFAITDFQFLALDLFASLLLAVVGLVLIPFWRWSATAAYVLLSLSIALTVVFYALELALGGSDFSSLLLERTGLVTPLISFVVLTLWDMATSGARFANKEGKNLPRAGRMLLYAGGLMQAAMATLFYTASGDPRLQDMANNALVTGLAILGVGYIVFAIWRRREMMIGSPVEAEEGMALLRRLPRAAWAAIVVLAAVAGCCLCLGIWTFWLATAE
jgi:hypothetical protein